MKPNTTQSEYDPQVLQLLHKLKPVPPRDLQAAARGRSAFLQQASSLQPIGGQPVSPARQQRHTGWITNLFKKKEPVKMSVLITILMILSLALGGTGVTVVAAQSSAPNQALYSLKLASEDARLGLASRAQTRLDLSLQFANRRVDEIAGLARSGQDIPEPVLNRWQRQLEYALALAAGLEDAEIPPALQRVQERLRHQEQVLQQLKAAGPVETQLKRVRATIHNHLVQVEEGLSDPAAFRLRWRENRPVDESPGSGSGNPWTTGTPTPGSGYGPGPGPDPSRTGTPQQSGNGGNNPWTTGTPTPGSGYGPGPGPDASCTCTPQQSGNGGNNPWTDDTPTPGSGYGPGPQTDPGNGGDAGGNGNNGGSEDNGENGGGGGGGGGGGKNP